MTADGHFPDLPEHYVFTFDFIPDFASGEELFQAFFQGGSVRGLHPAVQRQRSLVHESDTIFFLQRRHPALQGGLRPQGGSHEQQDRRHYHSFHRFFFSLVDTQ